MALVYAHQAEGFDRGRALRLACEELIPAAFHTDDGPLAPREVIFFHKVVDFRDRMLGVDVFIAAKEIWTPQRAKATGRAEAIKSSLIKLFPEHTFAVMPELVTADWACDMPTLPFDGDMSMAAALVRARAAIKREQVSVNS